MTGAELLGMRIKRNGKVPQETNTPQHTQMELHAPCQILATGRGAGDGEAVAQCRLDHLRVGVIGEDLVAVVVALGLTAVILNIRALVQRHEEVSNKCKLTPAIFSLST